MLFDAAQTEPAAMAERLSEAGYETRVAGDGAPAKQTIDEDGTT